MPLPTFRVAVFAFAACALPALAAAHAEGLVDAVDGFCEGIAFSPAQIARVFAAARGDLPPSTGIGSSSTRR